MKQIPLALGSDHSRRFDDFVAGDNVLAVTHLRGLGAAAAPVFLWGPPGSGKSHLLEAMVNRQAGQGARCGVFRPCDPTPWTPDARWSLIGLEDCDRYAASQQQAAFALFIEAADAATPIIASAQWPPIDLTLREDLRTRLGWGHVFELKPLAEREVRAALRREADRRSLQLADEVTDYLLTHCPRDLKHLCVLIQRLDDYSMSLKRAVTVPLLRQMLQDEGSA